MHTMEHRRLQKEWCSDTFNKRETKVATLTEMNQPNIAWLHLSEVPTIVKYRVKEGGVLGRGDEASGVSRVCREWL